MLKLTDIPAIINIVKPKGEGTPRMSMSLYILEHRKRLGATTSIPYNEGGVMISILWGADKTAKRIATIHGIDFGFVNQGEAKHSLHIAQPNLIEHLEVVELERWLDDLKPTTPNKKAIAEKTESIKANILISFPYEVADNLRHATWELFSKFRVELTLEEALELFKEKKLTVMVYEETLMKVDVDGWDSIEGLVLEQDLIVDSNS